MIKEYIRKYGSSSINFIAAEPTLKWIINKYKIEDTYVIDKFVLFDENYLAFKEAIKISFRDKNCNEILKVFESKPVQPFLSLVLYQNVTLLYKNFENNSVADTFRSLINNEIPERSSNVIEPLLKNSFTNCLKINNQNWTNIDLSILLVQIKYSILFANHSLIAPLRDLLKPDDPVDSYYLPTMPQDTLFDIKEALKAKQNSVLYS